MMDVTTFRDITDVIRPYEIKLTTRQAAAIKKRVNRQHPNLDGYAIALHFKRETELYKAKLLAKKQLHSQES